MVAKFKPGKELTAKARSSKNAGKPAPIKLCLDFLPYPDNFTFLPPPPPSPWDFILAGFKFRRIAGGNKLFVNVSGGGKGLQFPVKGLRIVLPFPAQSVRLKVGCFAGPVKAALKLSPAGATLAATTFTATNTYSTKTLNATQPAKIVELIGGNNEGILAEICLRGN